METQFTLTLNTSMVFDQNPDTPTLKAAATLRRDMENTLEPWQTQTNRIRIAALETDLPVEGWVIEASPQELLVRAADSLGCIYALLFISENFLGVTPFWFWNDQAFVKRRFVAIPLSAWRSPPYVVRYRGWFVNDEVLLENWKAEPGNREHWAMVFEALLRCGGNMTIPGTDNNSRKYRDIAADMGLWISHHHAEPLGAEMFSRAFPNEIPSYRANKILFEKLWEEAVEEQKKYRVIWALGFRGQGDRPFWVDDPSCVTAEQRGALMSRVIEGQFEILTSRLENPVCCVNLYGEIAELYQEGYLRLPPGLIKVWADNGYGRMVSRRQGSHNPRRRALPSPGEGGPHGIYFHCSFHDLQASNHLTMSPNSTEFLAAELGRILDAGAKEYWIVNCGSLKPHTHTLDLVSHIWQKGQIDVDPWRRNYAKIYYGEKAAEEAAAILGEYPFCTAKYGPHEDDYAGEQLWHHPARELLCAWIRGETEQNLGSLKWLTGDLPFPAQTERLAELCRGSLPRWEALAERCLSLRRRMDGEQRRFFDSSIYLQIRLQRSGAVGAAAFCESFAAWRSRKGVCAFLLACKSLSAYREGVKALEDAEYDKWTGYYRGDCLTDTRLTVLCLESLVSYLRVMGDGPGFHRWERAYLGPEADRKIMLLSSKKRAMSNGELAAALNYMAEGCNHISC
jgi:hypothetical protein